MRMVRVRERWKKGGGREGGRECVLRYDIPCVNVVVSCLEYYN